MFESEILTRYHSNILRHVHGGYGVWIFRRHFGRKVFVIRLLYRIFEEKLKIQRHHPFKLGFGFTMTCLMIVYENVMKFGTN